MSTKRHKRILIVDDQSNWRKMLRTLLEQDGYVVQEAVDFDGAKEKIHSSVFDLLILDMRLVDEDIFNVQGLELLKLAKSRKISPSVIILTGYSEGIREGVLDSLGVDALMLKVPKGGRFNNTEFKQQVRILLGQD